jgi:hypothetical protein
MTTEGRVNLAQKPETGDGNQQKGRSQRTVCTVLPFLATFFPAYLA